MNVGTSGGASQFDINGTNYVTSIDAGAGTAVAAKSGDQRKLATLATVSATRSAMDSVNNTVLGGIYKIDGTEKTVSYDNTAIAGTNGFESGAANLTDALKRYADNIQASTGTTFAADGSYTNSYAKPVSVALV